MKYPRRQLPCPCEGEDRPEIALILKSVVTSLFLLCLSIPELFRARTSLWTESEVGGGDNGGQGKRQRKEKVKRKKERVCVRETGRDTTEDISLFAKNGRLDLQEIGTEKGGEARDVNDGKGKKGKRK